MKRELFYIKDLDEFTLLDFAIIVILIVNLFLHLKGFNEIFFSISTLICFLLCMLKVYLYFKENKNDGYINTIRHPIIINDKDIYILHDNFNFINIVAAILVILLLSVLLTSIFIKSFNLFDTIVKYLSLSSIYIFLIDILFITAIVIVESKFIFRSLNIKYIEKNINNLDKIINSKKFKIDKIEDISLTNNNTYMAMYENAINNIIFDSKYERYDDLILLINERCSLTEKNKHSIKY